MREFQRIALEQLDGIAQGLAGKDDRDAVIHENRKSLKRLRALLRLVRPAIGQAAFQKQNAALRDIGLLFAKDRDRRVLLDTADALQEAMPARFAKTFAKIKGAVRQQRTPPSGVNGRSVDQQAREGLDQVRSAMLRLTMDPATFDAVAAGLKQSYRRGRRLHRDVYRYPSDEGFHDLRKSVQLQWRHMQLLSRAWPDLFSARVALARKLSQMLGDDHDLSVFAGHLSGLPRGVVGAAERRDLGKAILARQAQLRARAEPMCAQLFAERAGRFARRIAAVWSAADELAAHDRPTAAASPRKPKRRIKKARSEPRAS